VRLFLLSLIILCLSACGTGKSDATLIEKIETVPPKIEPRKGLSPAYADQLTKMCYAKIHKAVGSTGHRGLVWARCMEENVMPIEQRLKPSKSQKIERLYANLSQDMLAVYEGRTTIGRLNARWAQAQKAAGLESIRQYRKYPDASL
jgi:hypothetical protein